MDKITKTNLDGVDERLIRVFTRAYAMCEVKYAPIPEPKRPFIRVTCGVRTEAQQKYLLSIGKSRTKNSMHFPQKNGKSYAIDTVIIDDGDPDWDQDRFNEVAHYMRAAAIEEKVRVIWGGMFLGPALNDIAGPLDKGNMKARLSDYVTWFTARYGRKPFIDSPHFQLA